MRRKRGFTLVELLIVIIIVTVLASIAIPKFSDSSTRAKESRLKLFLQSVRDATERFHNDTGLWPQSTDLLMGKTPTQGIDDNAILRSINAADYHGPYFDQESFAVGIPGITSITYVNLTGGALKVGSWKVISSATASDGTAYTTW
ncbi:MAG: prepilin-type N-terminal cleavage/methylation domain-containing protein [Armatimonadota bacterium]